MPIPTILVGVLLSTLYGALFHFIRGGSTRILFLNLVLAWAGFWAGDSLGWYMNWTFGAVGVLNAGMGTVVALVLLLFGDLLRHLRIRVDEG